MHPDASALLVDRDLRDRGDQRCDLGRQNAVLGERDAARPSGRRLAAPAGHLGDFLQHTPRPAIVAVREAISEWVHLRVVRQLVDHRFEDRKSTRLNSSHSQISYAVFCLKKKKNKTNTSLI